MDKRLELTEKQKEIVKRYNDIVKEMGDADIAGIHYYDENNIAFFNCAQVSYIDIDCLDNEVLVNFKEFEQATLPFQYDLGMYDDDEICVCFRELPN